MYLCDDFIIVLLPAMRLAHNDIKTLQLCTSLNLAFVVASAFQALDSKCWDLHPHFSWPCPMDYD